MPTLYQNPIYAQDFADPFVLRTAGGFFAYGTAASHDGRAFPVLHSPDLVHWKALGGALQLPRNPAHAYWAPEVAELNGRYFLYYSSASTPSDDSHRLRVATADTPAGPFHDIGGPLMPAAGFSIDASPFHDPVSGNWYLFFAMDYENDEPYGTGLAVVPLSQDLLSVNGPWRPVLRACGDWQVYARNRDYKGKVWAKWHCVEGPHCVYRDGLYYLFYSGGPWYGETYGVSYATARGPLGPWEHAQRPGPLVLHAVPGKVIGPGHSSCAVGPDGTDMFFYHAWDSAKTARRMCMDPLIWTPDGPRVDGPSTEARPLGRPEAGAGGSFSDQKLV